MSTKLPLEGAGPYGVAPLSEGRVLVVADADTPREDATRLIRLTASGRVDRSFGRGGARIERGLTVLDVETDPSGRVIMAGSAVVTDGLLETSAFVVVALTPDGVLDTSFGDGGYAVAQRSYNRRNAAEQVAVLPDGRIVAGGSFEDEEGRLTHVLWRLLPDGSADPSFNGGQPLVGSVGYGGVDAGIQALTVEPSGSIVASGQNRSTPDPSAASQDTYYRVSADGSRTAPTTVLRWKPAHRSGQWLLSTPDGGVLTGNDLGLVKLSPQLTKVNSFPPAPTVPVRGYAGDPLYSQPLRIADAIVSMAATYRVVSRTKREVRTQEAVVPVEIDPRTGRRRASRALTVTDARYARQRNGDLESIAPFVRFDVFRAVAAPQNRVLVLMEVPRGRRLDRRGMAVLRVRLR